MKKILIAAVIAFAAVSCPPGSLPSWVAFQHRVLLWASHQMAHFSGSSQSLS